MLRRERLHAVEREEELEIHRLLGPERAVVVEAWRCARSTGTKSGEPSFVTFATKATMACLAVPSFQDGGVPPPGSWLLANSEALTRAGGGYGVPWAKMVLIALFFPLLAPASPLDRYCSAFPNGCVTSVFATVRCPARIGLMAFICLAFPFEIVGRRLGAQPDREDCVHETLPLEDAPTPVLSAGSVVPFPGRYVNVIVVPSFTSGTRASILSNAAFWEALSLTFPSKALLEALDELRHRPGRAGNTCGWPSPRSGRNDRPVAGSGF